MTATAGSVIGQLLREICRYEFLKLGCHATEKFSRLVAGFSQLIVDCSFWWCRPRTTETWKNYAITSVVVAMLQGNLGQSFALSVFYPQGQDWPTNALHNWS